MPTIPDPYARSIFHGKPLDNATIARLKQAEKRLGYELTILQGIGGAAASAGTHTEGRAVDLAPWDHQNKVRVLRDLGFAVWFRPTLPGVWNEHIHGVLIFDGRDNQRGIAGSAWRQIQSYDRGRNGLANDAADPNPYRPSPARGFSMADYRATFAESEPLKPAPPKPAPVKGLTIGTHNLHDEAGVPTLFADVLFFTEAIAPTIRARVKRRVARTRVALAGYRVVSAPENRTVVVAVKRRLIKVTGKEWHGAHGGKAGLTPARGTLLVRGVMRGTGQPVSLLAEHRINDSWKPSARELAFRKKCWRKHTDLTKRLASREIAAGRTVFAGGDTNTVRSMSAYEGVLVEAGHALDRLGVSPDMNITAAEVLSRRGSDHPRVRATVTPKESE